MINLASNLIRIRNFFQSRGHKLQILGDNPPGWYLISVDNKLPEPTKKDFRGLVQHVFLPGNWKLKSPVTFSVVITPDFVICKGCGCSDNNACINGCWWVREDLCSNCESQIKIK